MENYETIKNRIISNPVRSRFIIFDVNEKLQFGDFVISGLNTDGSRILGYVVQIRLNWGAFGTDVCFIRRSNGELWTVENQSFWKLTREQMESVLPFFEYTPEQELKDNPEHEYTIKNKQKEKGFIVSEENAPERFDTCAITISVKKGERSV